MKTALPYKCIIAWESNIINREIEQSEQSCPEGAVGEKDEEKRVGYVCSPRPISIHP